MPDDDPITINSNYPRGSQSDEGTPGEGHRWLKRVGCLGLSAGAAMFLVAGANCSGDYIGPQPMPKSEYAVPNALGVCGFALILSGVIFLLFAGRKR
jgi:hypothetical protein